MKLSNAINKLEKLGFDIQSNLGSYIASYEEYDVRFYENGLGSGETHKFTVKCNHTGLSVYGLSLKKAIEHCHIQ